MIALPPFAILETIIEATSSMERGSTIIAHQQTDYERHSDHVGRTVTYYR